jgi:hypothetical protein
MPRHHLQLIQPMVRSLCKKYNVHYHETSFISGTFEVFQHLAKVSNLFSARAA